MSTVKERNRTVCHGTVSSDRGSVNDKQTASLDYRVTHLEATRVVYYLSQH